MSIYKVLEKPVMYRMAQFCLAPGMDRIVTEQISGALSQVPAPVKVLDVGCGPSSWLWKFGLKPVGLDLCHAYTKKFHTAGNSSVTASAAVLPFPDNSFDLVFSFALLHHLPDPLARQTVEEIVRVTRPGGEAMLFDPMLPGAAWKRPQAWALCKLDRGHFIRSQAQYESRVLKTDEWKTTRFNHSWLGTEGVLSLLRKGREANDR